MWTVERSLVGTSWWWLMMTIVSTIGSWHEILDEEKSQPLPARYGPSHLTQACSVQPNHLLNVQSRRTSSQVVLSLRLHGLLHPMWDCYRQWDCSWTQGSPSPLPPKWSHEVQTARVLSPQTEETEVTEYNGSPSLRLRNPTRYYHQQWPRSHRSHTRICWGQLWVGFSTWFFLLHFDFLLTWT